MDNRLHYSSLGPVWLVFWQRLFLRLAAERITIGLSDDELWDDLLRVGYIYKNRLRSIVPSHKGVKIPKL